jgi:hypothetical protein
VCVIDIYIETKQKVMCDEKPIRLKEMEDVNREGKSTNKKTKEGGRNPNCMKIDIKVSRK